MEHSDDIVIMTRPTHKRLSIAKAPFQLQAPFIKDVPEEKAAK